MIEVRIIFQDRETRLYPVEGANLTREEFDKLQLLMPSTNWIVINRPKNEKDGAS